MYDSNPRADGHGRIKSVIAELPHLWLVEDVDAETVTKTWMRREIPPESQDPIIQRSRSQTILRIRDSRRKNDYTDTVTSRITLYGLLNTLDIIGAPEGRILIAMTKDYTPRQRDAARSSGCWNSGLRSNFSAASSTRRRQTVT
ncbi:hypothetical protein OH76DRAFT_552882 [Lentinus brumalis]|uniref:Uncharacterized protein n=1 Tax=Lentinus brumalis TaxID=2498619 RepID=A0A371D964_9APHY|nr:hypothetical protein OH76DRAFT_552882 [Polyporus brumalis]